ncbi:hypothetical protein ACFLW5_02340, partial [Chloroflexota bacterium]
LQAELSAKGSELKTAQSSLSTKESQLQTAEAKLNDDKAKIEILNDLFIPTFTGEIYTMTELEAINWFLGWRDKVIAIRDPNLTQKFETLMYAFSEEAIIDFILYLLRSIEAT